MNEDEKFAKYISNACIQAAREGFLDASLRGLCQEGAMEAAISAIQSLDLSEVINSYKLLKNTP